MTDPIEKAGNLSQSLFIAGKDTETQDILNALIDYTNDLQAALGNLLTAADGITPTEEEFLNETAAIDPDCWDDWDEAVREARDILNNES